MSSGARFGRTICLVLGVLSLAASMEALYQQVDARDGDPADTICGGVTNPREELSPGCAAALQAHSQSFMLRAVAGVGWMLGAVAFSMADRPAAGSEAWQHLPVVRSAHHAVPAPGAPPPPPGPGAWTGY
ncbi:MAG TPA: hypothetical protein VIL36_21255 [Acidimicrobiales bacterium]